MYCGTCGAEMTHDLGCPTLLTELVEMRRQNKLSNWQVAMFVELAHLVANQDFGYTMWAFTEKHKAQLNQCRTAAQFGAVFSKMIREAKEEG